MYKIMTGIKHISRQPVFLSLCLDVRTYSVCSTFPKSIPIEERNDETLKHNACDSNYYFEDGLRKVYPYYHSYNTFCKGRWVNRKIIDAVCNEYALYPREEYERRITEGVIKINNKKVGLDYIFKHSDVMSAHIHKHELPVLACPIEILFEDENFLVIDKPPSIPIHPCGLYKKNCLLSILANEYNKQNLFIIYRLDRVTTGVLLFAKSHELSRQLHGEIALRSVKKEYICRVEGNFPDGTVICNKPISQFYHKIGVCLVDPKGKEAVTEFQKLSYNGKSSVVLCKPHTGRTHQIRVHLQFLGHPIVNDPLYNSYVFGNLKAKNGVIEKSIMQLLEDVFEECSSDWELGNYSKKQIALSRNKYLYFSIFKEYYNMKEVLPKFKKDCSKIIYDEKCYFCKTPNHDPVQNSLGLFLHAYKYEGKDWSFKSNMPIWASDDWNIA